MSTGSGNPASPAAGHGVFGSSGAGGFAYGVGVSIGILLLLAIIAFAAFYFCCARTAPTLAAAPGAPRHGRDEEAGGRGVDEATLEAYPAMAYGEVRKQRRQEAEAEACCPVCLESYGDGEVVRELPECGHVFHRGCVDPWLRRRATCPVCRTSPLPSPLAEYVYHEIFLANNELYAARTCTMKYF